MPDKYWNAVGEIKIFGIIFNRSLLLPVAMPALLLSASVNRTTMSFMFAAFQEFWCHRKKIIQIAHRPKVHVKEHQKSRFVRSLSTHAM